MGPLLVLVCLCSRGNVVLRCKIMSFLCSLDYFLLKMYFLFCFVLFVCLFVCFFLCFWNQI